MFKFINNFAEVAGFVTLSEYSAAAERLTSCKNVFGYLVQEDVDENRIWAITEIAGENKETQYGITCLNANGRPVINMVYLDYYVPELRNRVIHIDQSYGRVAIMNARTLSRSYADIATCHEQRGWNGEGPAPDVELHIITPAMVDDKQVSAIADRRGIFIMHSDLSQEQIRSASAVLEVYRRIPVVESVIFMNNAVPA